MSAPRTHNRFDKEDLDGFSSRSSLKAEGFSELMFDGRSVIGIGNSWSELTSCNTHRDRPDGSRPSFLRQTLQDQAHDTGQPGTPLLAREYVVRVLTMPRAAPTTICSHLADPLVEVAGWHGDRDEYHQVLNPSRRPCHGHLESRTGRRAGKFRLYRE